MKKKSDGSNKRKSGEVLIEEGVEKSTTNQSMEAGCYYKHLKK